MGASSGGIRQACRRLGQRRVSGRRNGLTPTPRRRRRTTYTRPHGARHLLAAYDPSRDKVYGHIKLRKRRGEFLVFLRYVRSLYPPEVRIAIVLDNHSPHRSTKKDRRVERWAAANNVELAYTQCAALRHLALDGADHRSHTEQASMIRRCIGWGNQNVHDQRLKTIIN